jgi:hypothetical protein
MDESTTYLATLMVAFASGMAKAVGGHVTQGMIALVDKVRAHFAKPKYEPQRKDLEVAEQAGNEAEVQRQLKYAYADDKHLRQMIDACATDLQTWYGHRPDQPTAVSQTAQADHGSVAVNISGNNNTATVPRA